jgi:CRP-like cAMP-binding protein
MRSCLDGIRQTLSALGVDDEAEVARINDYCSLAVFDTGEHLHRAGTLANQVFFICSGLVRFYYVTEDGREHNKSFAMEHQFAGALQRSTHPEPSRFYIQALEPTTTLAISLVGLRHLFATSLVWANVGRLYMETVAVRKARREGEFLLDSAAARYERFLAEEPGLAKRLPLYHVASYLGITDVALSRIRRRMKEEGRLNPA